VRVEPLRPCRWKYAEPFFKQVEFLEQSLHHPSLRAKKYDESQDLWQARVNKNWRFYFLIQDGVYYIVDIIPHPK
jgi:mRNA interferase RelE/StbE